MTKYYCCMVAIVSGLLLSSASAGIAATFQVTNGNDSGAGSLRQAMLDANAAPGTDTITFNIAGGGPQEITPTVPLPRISDPVIIDGTTQPGYAGNPIIDIPGGFSRITIDSGGTTIKGMCFGGISIFTNGGNTIQNNYLGTDITGTQLRSDGTGGISIFNSSNNLIGGTQVGVRNLISNNGISINGNSSGNVIQGNYIGLDVTGTIALPNAREGICLCSSSGSFSVSNNLIGGTQPGAGNVIAASKFDDIQISGLADGNIVQGNLIGTNAAGTQIPESDDSGGHGININQGRNTIVGGSMPGARNVIAGMVDGSYPGGFGININGAGAMGNIVKGNLIGTDVTGTRGLPNYMGIRIFVGPRNNVIGGTAAGEGNTIAFNVRDGIVVSTNLSLAIPTTGNSFRGNSIHSNGELGIDLGNGTLVEVNANDSCDADGGVTVPNELQNYPVLTSTGLSGGGIQIGGVLNSVANAAFSIDFYRSPSAGSFGYGEGKTYLGSASVTTDGTCNAPFNVVLPIAGAGKFITATATDSNGNTSEFSQATTLPISIAPFDFDGDGKTDLSIFRPSAAEWWINRSSNGSTFAAQFGAMTDKLAAGDYTGDGKADIAIWRPSSGEWFILRSEDSSFFSFPFGTNGDTPMPADYDNDGKVDPAVFRESNATWYIRRSSDDATTIEGFGTNGDVPVAADYDGDGNSDIAIYRPSLGQWWIKRSTAGVIAFTFGNSTDKPVQGDYTGDGKADVAFWRPSTGEWYILRSEDFSYYSQPFGATSDIPSPGDYDGDGKFDPTVFRPSSATWFSQRSTAGTLIQQFGSMGDMPVPSAFVP